MKYTNPILLMSLISLFVLISGCKKQDFPIETPACIERQIEEIEKEADGSTTREVWRWDVDGNTYFFINSDCCDQFNYLYSQDCEVVCAPSGGLTGMGDGNCPTFSGEIEKTLIWKWAK